MFSGGKMIDERKIDVMAPLGNCNADDIDDDEDDEDDLDTDGFSLQLPLHITEEPLLRQISCTRT